MVYKILVLVVAIALAVVVFSGTHQDIIPNLPDLSEPAWLIHADQPLIAGGYGDNFAYNGTNVRALDGSLELRYDPERKTGSITVTLETTDKSGPLHVSASQSLDGRVELVSEITPSDRIVEDRPVFGSTGLGENTFPQTSATLAGWSRFTLTAGGKTVGKDLFGEWAIAQALRRADGSIRQSGLVYSPLLRDKTGFSNPKETQFVLLVHSQDADTDNVPPYTLALDLTFLHVVVQHQPTQSPSRTAG
jgi:hypothetical protein